LKVGGYLNCGSKEYHKKVHFPAAGRKCNACGKTCHDAPFCRDKEKKKKAGEVRFISVYSTTVGAVTAAEPVKLSVAPKVPSASAAQVLFLPDTGAELDAIPRETFRRAFKGVTLVPVASPETATGSPIMIDGPVSCTEMRTVFVCCKKISESDFLF
jgi:hypothetical protein